MQDLALILAPISAVVYFLVYPEQFHRAIFWIGHLLLQ
jgi:hypothetical protein